MLPLLSCEEPLFQQSKQNIGGGDGGKEEGTVSLLCSARPVEWICPTLCGDVCRFVPRFFLTDTKKVPLPRYPFFDDRLPEWDDRNNPVRTQNPFTLALLQRQIGQ